MIGSEPRLLNDGWYVNVGYETEQVSGPWNTRQAAEAAREEDYEKANRLHLAARKVLS